MSTSSLTALFQILASLAKREDGCGHRAFGWRRAGQRPTSRRGSRPGLELLECRITPTTYTLSTSPQQIPLPNVPPGKNVQLKVNLTIDNADPNDPSEGEGFYTMVLQAPGFSQTISTYGVQTISFPLVQSGEQLTAYLAAAAQFRRRRGRRHGRGPDGDRRHPDCRVRQAGQHRAV
jgi:hypothetical protein